MRNHLVPLGTFCSVIQDVNVRLIDVPTGEVASRFGPMLPRPWRVKFPVVDASFRLPSHPARGKHIYIQAGYEFFNSSELGHEFLIILPDSYPYCSMFAPPRAFPCATPGKITEATLPCRLLPIGLVLDPPYL
jgi:hypothetical protein